MDWNLAIKKNKHALAQIVAGLFVLVNWRKGERPPEVLGPITHRYLTTVLRKLEAALRRVIVLYANTQGLKPCADTKPHDLLPDFASFNCNASDHIPSFNLFDPRKPLVFITEHDGTSETAHRQSRETDNANLMPSPIRSAHLLKRLAALDHAIRNIPQQAKRLVRSMEIRKQAPPGPKRVGPIRSGFPPGIRNHGEDEIDHVLRECHGLVRDWEMHPP